MENENLGLFRNSSYLIMIRIIFNKQDLMTKNEQMKRFTRIIKGNTIQELEIFEIFLMHESD